MNKWTGVKLWKNCFSANFRRLMLLIIVRKGVWSPPSWHPPQPWKMQIPQGFRAFRVWKLLHGFDWITLKYHTKIALKIGNALQIEQISPLKVKKYRKMHNPDQKKKISCQSPLLKESPPFWGKFPIPPSSIFWKVSSLPLRKGGSNYAYISFT